MATPRESGLGGAESSPSTPLATPIATPVSTRSVKWEKDVEDAAAGTLDRPLLHKRCTNTTSQMAVVGANTCPIESLDYEYVPLCFLQLHFNFKVLLMSLLLSLL